VTIAAGLIVSRFVHYLALSVLFGGALFPFYGFAPPRADTQHVPAWLRGLLLGAALLTLLSGISWFVFTTAGMSGSLAGVADPAILSTMIRDTDFGRVWVLRLLLGSALVLLLLLPARLSAWRFHAVLFGSLVLLASIALTGHAGSDAGSTGLRHRIADAFHLVAAGVWTGALVVFARLVMMAFRQLRGDDLRALHHALARFSGVGTAVVAILILTGLINPGFFSSGLKTAYTQVLLVKLAMFVAMLLLAAANRFWLTPRLAATLDSTSELRAAMGALRTSLLTETALVILVLAAVAWLGTLAPTGVE
jgi:putative copper resistance protein D